MGHLFRGWVGQPRLAPKSTARTLRQAQGRLWATGYVDHQPEVYYRGTSVQLGPHGTDTVINLDSFQKGVQIAAIGLGGVWVYLKAIRDRTFIPRLQPSVSAKMVEQRGTQYLQVSFKVQNIGSSIAKIKEEGTGLVITAMQAFGAQDILALNEEKRMAFPIFGLEKGAYFKMEPGTILSSEEMIEVPRGEYDAFRIELRVSAHPGSPFSKTNRKWRAFAVVLGTGNSGSVAKEEA